MSQSKLEFPLEHPHVRFHRMRTSKGAFTVSLGYRTIDTDRVRQSFTRQRLGSQVAREATLPMRSNFAPHLKNIGHAH
jgi:hypothetical protein